jgi:hypothetical protein
MIPLPAKARVINETMELLCKSAVVITPDITARALLDVFRLSSNLKSLLASWLNAVSSKCMPMRKSPTPPNTIHILLSIKPESVCYSCVI